MERPISVTMLFKKSITFFSKRLYRKIDAHALDTRGGTGGYSGEEISLLSASDNGDLNRQFQGTSPNSVYGIATPPSPPTPPSYSAFEMREYEPAAEKKTQKNDANEKDVQLWSELWSVLDYG